VAPEAWRLKSCVLLCLLPPQDEFLVSPCNPLPLPSSHSHLALGSWGWIWAPRVELWIEAPGPMRVCTDPTSILMCTQV
jgi:hypothetical protein